MISLRGIYENGKIKLANKVEQPLPPDGEVILTFLLDEDGGEGGTADLSGERTSQSEAYYESLREYERVKAYGNITVIDSNAKFTFPLNDYSQGGLSFFSDKRFEFGQVISAGIADPTSPDLILMELEMEVRGVFTVEEHQDDDDGERFKVGCMFIDPVDEDLWHGLLQYLS